MSNTNLATEAVPSAHGSLLVPVGLAALVVGGLAAAVSEAAGYSLRHPAWRDQLVLTLAFVGVLVGLAPGIALTIGPSRPAAARLGLMTAWIVGLPAVMLLPLWFAMSWVYDANDVIGLRTFLLWMAGTIGGVGATAVGAARRPQARPLSTLYRRIVIGVGAISSALTLAVIVPFGLLLLGAYLQGRAAMQSPAPEFTFPQDFSGVATLTMPIDSAPPGRRVAGGWVFEFPATGELVISDSSLGAHRRPVFFSRTATGERHPLPRAPESECVAVRRDSAALVRPARDGVCYSAYRSLPPHRVFYEFIVLRARENADDAPR